MPESAYTPPDPNPQRAADAPAPGREAPQPDRVAEAKKEAADNYDRYLRAVADLENFRRRATREKEELRLYAAGRLLEDLIPVVDHLGLAVGAARQPKAELKTLSDGVAQVLQQLKGALAGHGLKEINPAGQPFDPHQHDAISHEPSAEMPAEHVLTVVRPGYLLNTRLLRPAAVVVSSGPAAEPKTP